MGLQHLLDRSGLEQAYEMGLIDDYYAGKMDGWSLIERGLRALSSIPSTRSSTLLDWPC
jgi:hypothetical protein